MSHFPISFQAHTALQTIAIGASGAAWVVQAGVKKFQLHSSAWQEQQTASQAIDSLLQRLSIARSSAVQWVVAPSLLKHWLLEPPDHIQSLSELHAVSCQRAQQLFGGVHPSSTNDHASSWIVSADWHASRAFLCAAMSEIWYAALIGKESIQTTLAASNKVGAIVSPLQLILSKFQKQVPTQGWLAVAVANTLYLMYFSNQKLVHFRSLQLENAFKAEELQKIALVEWQRDMLRTQLNSEQLHWLCWMPIDAVSNPGNALLKPLQWHRANTQDVQDVENKTYLGSQTNVQIDLSEAKLVAWCAVQCSDRQL